MLVHAVVRSVGTRGCVRSTRHVPGQLPAHPLSYRIYYKQHLDSLPRACLIHEHANSNVAFGLLVGHPWTAIMPSL
jgi:hypothetical protein